MAATVPFNGHAPGGLKFYEDTVDVFCPLGVCFQSQLLLGSPRVAAGSRAQQEYTPQQQLTARHAVRSKNSTDLAAALPASRRVFRSRGF